MFFFQASWIQWFGWSVLTPSVMVVMFPAVSGWASITMFLRIIKEYAPAPQNLRQYFQTVSQWHYQVLSSVRLGKKICQDFLGKSESGDLTQKNVFNVSVEK